MKQLFWVIVIRHATPKNDVVIYVLKSTSLRPGDPGVVDPNGGVEHVWNSDACLISLVHKLKGCKKGV